MGVHGVSILSRTSHVAVPSGRVHVKPYRSCRAVTGNLIQQRQHSTGGKEGSFEGKSMPEVSTLGPANAEDEKGKYSSRA
jgi:hypothetical protein